MRKYLVAILSVLTFVVFTGGAFADENVKPAPVNPKNPCAGKKNCGLEGVHMVTGTLKSIDKKKGEMVLTGEDGKDTTFKIKEMQGKKVKAGDKVEVTCMIKGEECYARKVTKVEKSRSEKP